MIKHYVDFDTPGFILPEREVETRRPSEVKDIPKNTYSMTFFDREEVDANGETLRGKKKNVSPRILFGTKYDLKGLEKLGYSEKDRLYRNIKWSYKFAVKCITGHWQGVNKKEIILANYADLEQLKEVV